MAPVLRLQNFEVVQVDLEVEGMTIASAVVAVSEAEIAAFGVAFEVATAAFEVVAMDFGAEAEAEVVVMGSVAEVEEISAAVAVADFRQEEAEADEVDLEGAEVVEVEGSTAIRLTQRCWRSSTAVTTTTWKNR